jgi:hypothetical protein
VARELFAATLAAIGLRAQGFDSRTTRFASPSAGWFFFDLYALRPSGPLAGCFCVNRAAGAAANYPMRRSVRFSSPALQNAR